MKLLVIGHMYAREENRAPFELLREEMDVSIYYPASWKGEFNEVYNDAGFKALRLPFPNSYIPMIGDMNDFDVLWLDEEPYYPQSYFILKHCSEIRLKIIRSAQNIEKRGIYRDFMYKSASSKAQSLCAVGVTSAETLRSMTGREDVNIVPLHISDGIFGNERKAHEMLTLGFAGRMEKSKGTDWFIDILNKIDFKCRVLTAGAGPEMKKIERTCSDNNIEISNRGVLNQKEMAEFYCETDVFLNLSIDSSVWKEQQGRAVIEAAASGAYVISSDSGELVHTMKGMGVLVRQRDTEAVLAALRDFINGGIDTQIIERAMNRAGEFSSSACSRKIMEVIRKYESDRP